MHFILDLHMRNIKPILKTIISGVDEIISESELTHLILKKKNICNKDRV